MKISIGSNIVKGPWGGGNQFAINLSDYLRGKGWLVTDSLDDNDIDIIVMTEPRKSLISCKYNQKDISKYLIKNPDTIVVHRINECDERKNTKNVNLYLKRANKVADHTVFISAFLEGLFIRGGIFDTKNYSVIRNGADSNIFNLDNRIKWNKAEPVKMVTHHWGGNYYKGFDVYEIIDSMIGKEIDDFKIDFTYIGNLPEGFIFKNSTVLEPIKGKDLAGKIKDHHVYITASINEPGGMHHIEGAMCGLPLLFRNSGAIPEHAKGFGIMFDGPGDFEDKLKNLIKNYSHYYNKIQDYPYDSNLMCSKYERLFLELLKKKDDFDLSKRKRKYLIIYLKEKFLLRKYSGDN